MLITVKKNYGQLLSSYRERIIKMEENGSVSTSPGIHHSSYVLGSSSVTPTMEDNYCQLSYRERIAVNEREQHAARPDTHDL